MSSSLETTTTTPVKPNGSFRNNNDENNDDDDYYYYNSTTDSNNVFPTEQLFDTTGRYEVWSIRIPRDIEYDISENQQYELQLTHDEQGYDLMLVDDNNDNDPKNNISNDEDIERRVCYYHIGDIAECESFRIIAPPLKIINRKNDDDNNNDDDDDDDDEFIQQQQPIVQFTKHVNVIHYQPTELLSDQVLAPPIKLAPEPLDPKSVRQPYKSKPTKHGLKRRWYPIGGAPPVGTGTTSEHGLVSDETTTTTTTTTKVVTSPPTNQFRINNVTRLGTTSNRLPPTCTINFPTTNITNDTANFDDTFYYDTTDNSPIGYENSPSNNHHRKRHKLSRTTPNGDDGEYPIRHDERFVPNDYINNKSPGTSSVTVPVIKMETTVGTINNPNKSSSKHDDKGKKKEKKNKDKKEGKEHKKNKEDKKDKKEKKDKKDKKDKEKEIDHTLVKEEESTPKQH